MKVRDYECDVQGHVNNANYQHYFEVTRHELLEKVGSIFMSNICRGSMQWSHRLDTLQGAPCR
jgi:acyl-CoA thioesterase FadM